MSNTGAMEPRMQNSMLTHDVLVIGGGPAGSTIAALLASRGKSVILVEKDTHPRFHIGESLLPFNIPLLDRLGVLAQVKAIGMQKFGIEFISPHHDKPSVLEFGAGWYKDMDYAFQVRRAEFDDILLRNAAAKGAEIVEAHRITDVEFSQTSAVIARATGADGTPRHFSARFVVDASGRDTFLAGRLRVKERNRRHASAAVFGHFVNAERLEGRAEGHISIFWFDKGWFWFIPLADGTTSVGAVCAPETVKSRGDDISALFDALIARCPALKKRLAQATRVGAATGTGNYSYSTTRMVGDRYLLVGDAGGFIDPVFSTGVYLAMHGAERAAEAVAVYLATPARARGALRQFERETRSELNRFSWFIYRMTRPAIRSLFMAPRNYFRIEEAVLALLSGDVGVNSPIRSRLTLFKGLFYLKTCFISAKTVGTRLFLRTGRFGS